MHKKHKDSASSFEQALWKYAVAEYARMKRYLIDYPHNSKIVSYATNRILSLEKAHPQLTKD